MGTMVWTTPDTVRFRINRSDVFAINKDHKGDKYGPTDYWGGCARIGVDVGGDAFRGSDGFAQHLSLYEAEEVIEGDGVRVRCFVASGRDVLVVEIDDRRAEPQALRVNLGMWRDPVVVNGDHTARYDFHDLPGTAALGQKFTEAEYYCGSAGAARVVGVEEVHVASDSCHSIGVPAASGKRLMLISSAASWDPDTDLVAAAGALLDGAAGQTYADLRAAHTPWWAAFWSRTFVHLTSDDGVADFMERVRNLQLYYMASSSRGSLPAKWNGSLFLTEGDTTGWGSQFWVWTTQISYYPLHAADAVELTDPFFAMYVNQLPDAVTAGQQRTGAGEPIFSRAGSTMGRSSYPTTWRLNTRMSGWGENRTQSFLLERPRMALSTAVWRRWIPVIRGLKADTHGSAISRPRAVKSPSMPGGATATREMSNGCGPMPIPCCERPWNSTGTWRGKKRTANTISTV